MASQELIDYIKKANEAGYNDELIRQKLIESGWNIEDIDEAISKKVSIKIVDDDLFVKPPKIFENENIDEKVEVKPVKKMCVLSIIAFIFAFLMPILGFILGIISLIIILIKKKKGLGFAIAAIVISVVISLLVFLFLNEVISNIMHIEI